MSHFVEREIKLINHFSHKHQLKFYEKRIEHSQKHARSSSLCPLCGKWIHLPVYGCKDCGIFIHKWCAELPQELSHPFHPSHVLSIQKISALINSSSSDQKFILCDACGKRNSAYVYHCPECNFNLDMWCSQLKPNKKHEAYTPQNSHQHPLFVCPLFVCDPYPIRHHLFSCSFCKLDFQDEIFVCLDCRNLLHELCAPPPPIIHPFHLQQHPLTFNYSTKKEFKCNACSMNSPTVVQCSQCKFSLDLKCFTLTPAIEPCCKPNMDHQGFTHPHPLIHCVNVKENLYFRCSSCTKILRDSAFVCLECGILQDKSCAEFPGEITHPFHPFHPLKLAQFPPRTCRTGASDDFNCRVCFYCIGSVLYYVCLDCQFYIDPRCSSITTPVQLVKSKAHHHPLAFRRTVGQQCHLSCNSCHRWCRDNFFQCVSCEFGYHLRCYPYLPSLIKHDCHCDPLEFTQKRIREMSDVDSDEEFFCHACEEKRDLDDPSYYCKECRFVAHPHCVISEILRYIETDSAPFESSEGKELCEFHPPAAVPELPQVQSNPSEVTAELKEELSKAQSNPSEVAAESEILLEFQSNPSVERSIREEIKLINQFRHKHPLKLYEQKLDTGWKDPWSSSLCHLCGKSELHKVLYGYNRELTKFPAYGCKDCGIFIHKSCAELPQKLSHPFHPNHFLSIQKISALINSSSSDQKIILCDACGISNSDTTSAYVYHCPECNFNLDMWCSQLKPNKKQEAYTPQNSHQHPLFVCDPSVFDPFVCSLCKLDFQDEIFVCLDCRNLLHELCALPPQIIHPFHLQQHPLTFNYSTKEEFKCNACSMNSRTVVQCSQCKFSLDLKCVTLAPAIELCCKPNMDHQGFTHPHPLIHCVNVKKNLYFQCSDCRKILRDSVFVCLECGILLDKSCAELPGEITHPFHPFHPLKLVDEYYRSKDKECRVCFSSIKNYFLYYVCLDCQFYVHAGCASITTPVLLVKSKAHHHPLAFFRTTGPQQALICDSCHVLCWENFFQCVSCKFGYHLSCYPYLPPLIKHDCHCDPLEFTQKRIREMSDVDSDEEFFCHACEETRDLDDPSYYCKECRFVAHPHCVISEIVRYIETESKAPSESSKSKEPPAAVPEAMSNLSSQVATVSGELSQVQSDPSKIAAELKEELSKAQSNPPEVADESEKLPEVQSNPSDVEAESENLPEVQSIPSEVESESENLPEVQSHPSDVAAESEILPEFQSNPSEVAAESEILAEVLSNPSKDDQKKPFLLKKGLLAFGHWIASGRKKLMSKSKH